MIHYHMEKDKKNPVYFCLENLFPLVTYGCPITGLNFSDLCFENGIKSRWSILVLRQTVKIFKINDKTTCKNAINTLSRKNIFILYLNQNRAGSRNRVSLYIRFVFHIKCWLFAVCILQWTELIFKWKAKIQYSKGMGYY